MGKTNKTRPAHGEPSTRIPNRGRYNKTIIMSWRLRVAGAWLRNVADVSHKDHVQQQRRRSALVSFEAAVLPLRRRGRRFIRAST